MLSINKQIENGTALYTLEGVLDTITSPALSKDLKASIDGVTDLTFDFAKVEYLTSAGLRVLLAAQKAMDEREGRMRVLHVNDSIMEVFEMTGFAAVLDFDEA